MMEFEFQELMADILGISDEDREEGDFIIAETFESKYGMDFEDGFAFAQELLQRTVPIKAALGGQFHAFMNKKGDTMLMRTRVKEGE